MKIRAKIITVFLIGLLLMLAATAYSNYAGQQLLLRDAGRYAQQMTLQWIGQIGRDLDVQLNYLASVLGDTSLKAHLARSNAHFTAIEERDAAIARQDKVWSRTTSAQFIDTPLSAALRDRLTPFFKAGPDATQHAEALLTNRYGAIAAQTHRTAGYSQIDTSWWRQARSKGVHIEVIRDADDQGGKGLSIAMRIDGQNGEFAGIIRVVAPLSAIIPDGLLGRVEANILAGGHTLQLRIYFFVAIIALLVLAAAWLVAGSIVDPISRLRQASLEAANGNLSRQVGVRGRDEVAQLARAFNRMITVLNVTCMQLRQKVASCEMAQILLEENEHRLFQFLDAMPVGVFITDHTGAPYFANQAAQSILGEGIGPDQLTHAYPLYVVGTNEPYPEERMPIVQALKGQFATADDMEIHHPGRRIPIMVWASPVYDARGKILFATAAFSDISKQREAENALKESARELQRSNAELEQFAYIASHDLQEPLRKVGSYMELVADRYREQLDQDGREFIDYAVDGARRMKVMINDLLAYSRVGTKGKPFAPTDTTKVIQDVLHDLELSIQDSGARITFDSLPVVAADETQLQQLFRNLIGNAVKYRGEDPPQIHISAQRQKQAWRFCVQDNGIGMEERFFERIFHIFQRLHGHGRYNGTGIGLAICKKIVERHGGSIEVESTPGQGSAFYFTMPVMKEN